MLFDSVFQCRRICADFGECCDLMLFDSVFQLKGEATAAERLL